MDRGLASSARGREFEKQKQNRLLQVILIYNKFGGRFQHYSFKDMEHILLSFITQGKFVSVLTKK